MILLLGGTSETAMIAQRLAGAGFAVLVSTATGTALDVGTHPLIRRRCGRLDAAEMEAVLRAEGIRALVDAAHPYAEQLHAQAQAVARRVPVPYLRYVRPCSSWDPSTNSAVTVPDHAAAAIEACSHGRPVLLTTGSRNLEPYCREAARRGVALVVRVLPEPESQAACRRADLDPAHVIAERGPFTCEQTRAHLRQARAGVLVTKESGAEGGFEAKLEAARQEQCRVVVVRRPVEQAAEAYATVDALVAAVTTALGRG